MGPSPRDREKCINNDISENDIFFEGQEKLLEIWFEEDPLKNENDLRLLPKYDIEEILDKCGCKILGFIKNKYWDSYVLSESSLFISCKKLILKTCGQTTLLLCLQKLINSVKKHTSFISVQNLFYSRKTLLKPEQQLYPHESFKQEIEYLEKIFPDGKSYCFGENDSRWLVHLYENNHNNNVNRKVQDFTFEILMESLENDVSQKYVKRLTSLESTMFKKSGLEEYFKEYITETFEFDPFGFSLNALKDSIYSTIHVTPQEICSYASFETNIAGVKGLVACLNILKLFRPRKFTITMFTSDRSVEFLTYLKSLSNYNIVLNSQVTATYHDIYFIEAVKKIS